MSDQPDNGPSNDTEHGAAHEKHELSVQPDVDNLAYRPWCHDCETFVTWTPGVEKRVLDTGTEQ